MFKYICIFSIIHPGRDAKEDMQKQNMDGNSFNGHLADAVIQGILQ